MRHVIPASITLWLVGSVGCSKNAQDTPAPTAADAAAPAPTAPNDAAPSPTERRAKATMQGRAGSNVSGEAQLIEKDGRVMVKLQMKNLPPGEHGFHLHVNGDCSAPDFSSVGEHFAPKAEKHGGPLMAEHHPGDFGNISVPAGKSEVSFEISTPALTLDMGVNSAMGRALVVHAGPDDLKTQPSGGSGEAIACGVVQSIPEGAPKISIPPGIPPG